jgi:hypothetical protein
VVGLSVEGSGLADSASATVSVDRDLRLGFGLYEGFSFLRVVFFFLAIGPCVLVVLRNSECDLPRKATLAQAGREGVCVGIQAEPFSHLNG